ncbi:MAG: glutaredoxin family protein [Burkholderiales bacterium]
MKWFFKLFFKTFRIVMTPFMLLWEKMTTPKGVVRQPEAQQLVNRQCKNLALYQFNTCPFCIKVRRELSRLSLTVTLLDAQKNPQHREDLLQGGGRVKVPCLKITDEQGGVQWMYESSEIIRYLQEKFA